MRVFARLGTFIALVLSAWASVPAVADTTPATFAAGQHFVVVTFANDPYRSAPPAGTTGRRYASTGYGLAQSANSNAHRIAADYSLKEVASWPIKALGVHCVVYQIPDSRSIAEVLAALKQDRRITLAQPLQEFRTLTAPEGAATATAPATPPAAAGYNDPLYNLQTNLVSLGISAAHERSQGAGVKIALIDTGVDNKHPDLRDRISGTRSFVTTSSSTQTSASSYRHGTAMAGLIAAVANNKVGIVGIAPLARIEVFEACWQLRPNADEAACNTFTLAQAIAAALEARIPLINLSIAGPADPLLSALVQSGLKRGVIFVGSATNDADAFPTNINGVIAVSNSETETPPRPGMLAAPATHVLTLRPDAQYDFESGTSVAAAEITGVIALLLGADSHLSTSVVLSLLRATDPARPATIDVDGALAKVEAEKGAGRLARSH
jgi:subtilisin family serine protease